MAFRLHATVEKTLKEIKDTYACRDIFETKQAYEIRELLDDITSEYGYAVERYPTWHPLVSLSRINKKNYGPLYPNSTVPDYVCGYKGLKYSRYFQNAFITCSFNGGDEILNSVKELDQTPLYRVAEIKAKKLDITLLEEGVTPVLVYLDWEKDFHCFEKYIPASIAIPLMLETELPEWRTSHCGETWETMKTYFLGEPHGQRSSVFVDKDTGTAMKKIWEYLNNTGMYGPIHVCNQNP